MCISARKQERRFLGGTRAQSKRAELPAKRQIEICMIRSEHFSNLPSDVFAVSEFPQRAPFNVTKRGEVMKWSNYVSICAIQMKPGVKFPICAPAASPVHCVLQASVSLLDGNIPDMEKILHAMNLFSIITFPPRAELFPCVCLSPKLQKISDDAQTGLIGGVGKLFCFFFLQLCRNKENAPK